MIGILKETFGPEPEHFGFLAEFPTPGALMRACERVRDAGYSQWDAHSPFPVHGLDKAMGLKASPLPFIVFVAAMIGAGSALLLQWWVSARAYELVISGKPFFSWPAFVPIIFELGVLFGALGALLGMFALNRLPRHHHPLFAVPRFDRASDDGFFISIESGDPQFDLEKTRAFLMDLQPAHLELVES